LKIEPRLNIGLANYGHGLAVAELLDGASAADAAGIDGLTLVDHVVLGGDLDDYPYGSFPGGLDAPWLEPLTTLATIAGRTSRIRLATGILIAPLRGAAVLAKTAATLDVLSGGRLDLGVGSGWLRKEYAAAGLSFAERGQLLDDTLAACQALWRGGATSFRSPRLEFDDVWCQPTPVQPGGVPLWIGGELHRRNLERIVRHGSGWIPSPTATLDHVRAGVGVLRTALSAAGRDAASVRIRVALPIVRDQDRRPLLEQTLEAVPELLALGATDVHTALAQWCREPGEIGQCCERLAASWRASIA
jgi:probable F420-dependent oxidoreductase